MKSRPTIIPDQERMIKAARDAQDLHTRMLGALTTREEHSVLLRQIMADLKLSRERTGFVTGWIEELHRANVFGHRLWSSRALEQMKLNMAVFDARFRLPDLAETVRLVTELPLEISEVLKRYKQEQSRFRRGLENMRSPWLDREQTMRSLGGIAALQGISHALRNMQAFGQDLSEALRIDLGDWRETITWRPEILKDPGARSDFYVDLGFNRALTDFPAVAFEESLDVVGLDDELPSLVSMYGEPIAASDDEAEEVLSRTNKAHDWLLRLETQVRRFIDEQMTKAFGPDWPKQQLPAGLYDSWKEKQQKARQSGGRVWALIAYADFTDYMRVIAKRDNWSVFAPYFGRLEDVRESFQRLHPIRLDTMHARPITQDDELLLYVEVRRLVTVMTHKKKENGRRRLRLKSSAVRSTI